MHFKIISNSGSCMSEIGHIEPPPSYMYDLSQVPYARTPYAKIQKKIQVAFQQTLNVSACAITEE